MPTLIHNPERVAMELRLERLARAVVELNRQMDGRETVHAASPPAPDLARHEAARQAAEKVWSWAVMRYVSAAEAEALRKERRQKAEEELTALWLLLSEEAAERAYHAVTTAMAGPALTAPEPAQEFARSRRQYLEPFAADTLKRLESAAQVARKAKLPERTVAAQVHAEGKAIEEGRGEVVTKTEGQAAYGAAQLRLLKQAGFKLKAWVTVGDERVRESHTLCEEQGAIPIGTAFQNGLQFPGDPNGGPEEVANCRCVLEGIHRKP